MCIVCVFCFFSSCSRIQSSAGPSVGKLVEMPPRHASANEDRPRWAYRERDVVYVSKVLKNNPKMFIRGPGPGGMLLEEVWIDEDAILRRFTPWHRSLWDITLHRVMMKFPLNDAARARFMEDYGDETYGIIIRIISSRPGAFSQADLQHIAEQLEYPL